MFKFLNSRFKFMHVTLTLTLLVRLSQATYKVYCMALTQLIRGFSVAASDVHTHHLNSPTDVPLLRVVVD